MPLHNKITGENLVFNPYHHRENVDIAVGIVKGDWQRVWTVMAPHVQITTLSMEGKACHIMGVNTAAYYDLLSIPYGKTFTAEELERFAVFSEACDVVFGFSYRF